MASDEFDDLLEVIERRWLLDLGQDGRAAASQLARLGDVLATLHEGQGDPGDAERHGEVDIGAIFFGHGAERKHGVWQADALAAAEHAAGHHLGVDPDVARLDDAQLELAVVEQHGMAGLHGLEDLGMRQVHAPQAAHRLAPDEAHHVAFGEPDRAGFEFADAELWSLEIDQDADGARELGLELAHCGMDVAQAVMRRVAHVHAEHVGTRLE